MCSAYPLNALSMISLLVSAILPNEVRTSEISRVHIYHTSTLLVSAPVNNNLVTFARNSAKSNPPLPVYGQGESPKAVQDISLV